MKSKDDSGSWGHALDAEFFGSWMRNLASFTSLTVLSVRLHSVALAQYPPRTRPPLVNF